MRAARRVIAWLRRHGHLDERPLEARSNEPPVQTALDACASIAMGRGNVTTMSRDGTEEDDGHGERRPDAPALVVERDGFNLHAGVRIAAVATWVARGFSGTRLALPCRSGGSGACREGVWHTGSST